MGVRGLETFMERGCDDVTQRVNIHDLAKQYKEKTGRREAVLLVDGLSIMKYLYTWRGTNNKGEGLSWLNGGQLAEYGERVKRLVDRLRAASVTPIFFFDGPLELTKRSVWQNRRLQNLNDLYQVLDSMAHVSFLTIAQFDTQLDQRQLCVLPLGTISTLKYFVEHVCNAKVMLARKECDLEIVEYAQSNGCMGVLTQDSDFVIHNLGGGLYLSAKHLDLETLTTVAYDQNRLARRLSLNPAHLPLLASVLGNDFISYDDLKDFHQRVVRGWRFGKKNLVDAVAAIVRQENPFHPSLERVASEVFRNSNKASVLEQSIESYTAHHSKPNESEGSSCKELNDNENDVWNNIMRQAMELYLSGHLSSQIYQIMRDRLFTVGTNIEDFRINDWIPSAIILSPLRQRLYGVIFYEKEYGEGGAKGKDITVEELAVTGLNCFETKVIVKPLYPPEGVHPGLLTVWANEDNKKDERIEAQWRLISYVISVDESQITRIRNEIPPRLIVLVLALIYIVREVGERLKDWEVRALIAMGACRGSLDPAQLAALPTARVLPRAQTIYTVFGRTVEIVRDTFSVCGNPLGAHDAQMFKFMDGKLYHEKYRRAQKLSGESASTSSFAAALCNNLVPDQEVYNRIERCIYDCMLSK